ncbi:MAG: hypothetical protein ACJAVN_002275 [Roseivirga sp.]|jgi:hypothetical protein
MSNTLHILNGDSTLNRFKASGIEGETFVWREVLSDGPVPIEFGSDAFWSVRDSFMTPEFNLESGQYLKDIIPFKALEERLAQYQEIVLWFEYDLFCQINMIALIQWIGKQNLDSTISLVCVGKIDDSDQLFGLGEIEAMRYTELLESRLKLGAREFDFCSDVYEGYCSTDPNDLYNYILMSFSGFPYLPDALEAHLKRFPNKETGLTEIEKKLVSLIQAGETDKMQLIGKMLSWQRYHGFGDQQYINVLNRLKPLFEDFETLVLKSKLNKEEIEKLVNRDNRLGGAKLSDWYWDDQEKTLIPREPAS